MNKGLCQSKLLLCLLMLCCLTTFTSHAQDAGDFPPITPSPQEQAEMDAALDAHIENRNAEMAKRELFDFQIVYLIAEDAEVAIPEMHPDKFKESAGAHIVHTWDDFLKIDEELPVQVVFLHASMLDQVDVEWMKHAYRNSVIIFGIGTPADEFKAVIGENCFKTPNRKNANFEEQQKTRFINFTYFTKFSDGHTQEEIEKYKPLVDEDKLINCKNSYTKENISVFVVHGSFSAPIYLDSVFDSMLEVIRSIAVEYDIMGNKPAHTGTPTATP